jgi:hypothetical protein
MKRAKKLNERLAAKAAGSAPAKKTAVAKTAATAGKQGK